MLIRTEHLCKTYAPGVTPLRDVNCTVDEGDVIAVIGPSGTGKSTFLNLLNRLEEPSGGKIWFEGEDTTAPGYNLAAMRRRMGMVFQSFNLFSHLTIVENAMLGPVSLLGLSRQDAYDRARRLLASVGLAEQALRYPRELSGGQQQRAAVVRAMAMEPRVLLLDEPTSALDPTMVGEVLTVIRSLARQGVTMLIVTHEMRFAREVSNRVFYMDEGRVYEEGTPDQVFDRPGKEKTRQFVRNLKVFRFSVREDPGGFPALSVGLERFAARCLLPGHLLSRIRMVAEEIMCQLPGAGDGFTLLVEYTERAASAEVTVTWEGEKLDLLAQGDPVSAALIRHACPDAAWDANGGLNCVHGTVR